MMQASRQHKRSSIVVALSLASIQFFKRKITQPPIHLCHSVQAIARYGIFSVHSYRSTVTSSPVHPCHLEGNAVTRDLCRQSTSQQFTSSPLTTPVTSSLPAFLGRQVIFDRKLYREVLLSHEIGRFLCNIYAFITFYHRRKK